jgi:sugar phosphate isomerase/epimerase
LDDAAARDQPARQHADPVHPAAGGRRDPERGSDRRRSAGGSRIGVDSYSYHRLLGELRRGEPDPGWRLADGGAAVIAEARVAGAEAVSLETCFLDSADGLESELELAFSWGAPNGLEFGASEAALADLLAWIEIAAAAGTKTMRIVVAGPALRGREPIEAALDRTLDPLARAADAASAAGVELAVENHGDLTAEQLGWLLDRVDVGVCFDTANALRVGDDVLEAAELLAPRVKMVHLKDVEPIGPDTDAVAGPRSVPYGTGAVPVEAVLDRLRFDGLVCVELGQLGPGDDERTLIAESVEWLQTYRGQ